MVRANLDRRVTWKQFVMCATFFIIFVFIEYIVLTVNKYIIRGRTPSGTRGL